jgi:hypothetical protein
MAPEERALPRFAAEPPQDELPYGRREERLRAELMAAVSELDTDGEDLGTVGEPLWYPDRSWHGWTYVPATVPTENGYELFGYVRFASAREDGGEPGAFSAQVDFTSETAAENPDWELDICDEVIGAWRGPAGAEAAMTLVWGRPLLPGGRIVTAELGDLAVDQCEIVEERFTLIAPDDYRGDLLEVKLFDFRGAELARESLYAGEDGDGDGGAGAGETPEAATEG